MASAEEAGRAAGRERGLRAVRAWTWTAGLVSAMLTAALAVVAAGSFAGRQAAAATPTPSPSPTSQDPAVVTPDNPVPAVPQATPLPSIGATTQPPAAVSGGS